MFSSKYSLTTAKAYDGEPKKLYAYNKHILGPALCLGLVLGPYAVFRRGFNLLWFPGAMIPCMTTLLYNHSRQPGQHLQNCYSYILAKR